jgi:lipopolysaccharide export LptBFGC system permease protein LptF
MVFKTLHSYIFRELLRIFVLTATALTTLMAFGGTFRPLTRQGIEIGQLMGLLLNLMPAMLAYAIPIAALFAAVLVYWRMSTDNELTACRAGGISFITIVLPAFALGAAVMIVDFGFVNYVVPRFLQKTEQAVLRDLGSLIVGQINKNEKFAYDRMVVYADGAELEPSADPDVSEVVLRGMAATLQERGKPFTVVAREARLRIHNIPGLDATEMSIEVKDASAFDPSNTFRKLTFSLDSSVFNGRPYPVPSLLKSKPKFLNFRQLQALNQDPSSFPGVAEIIAGIADMSRYEVITERLQQEWQAARAKNKPLVLEQSAFGSGPANELRVYAAAGVIDPEAAPDKALSLTGTPVRVEQWVRGRLESTFTADAADVALSNDQLTGTGVSASLELHGNVKRRDHIKNIDPVGTGSTSLSGIVLPNEMKSIPGVTSNLQDMTGPQKLELLDFAAASPQPKLRKLRADVGKKMQDLFQKIKSEFHSRASFSVSCLTLVLFGAALGILLRGKNPLAVFVLGFVPAIVLVLLITAGRQLAEGDPRNVTKGIVLIWAGNAVLLALVAGVYGKLLRQ